MNETTRIASWTRAWSWIAAATAAGLFLMAGVLLTGCAEPAKPDPDPAPVAEQPVTPEAAFNEICNRSLSDDLSFVKSRLSPLFVEQLGGPADDQPVRKLMDELRTCRAVSILDATQAGKVTLQVAQGQTGIVRLFRVDLIQNPDGGWLLAGRPYDEQPLPKPQGSN